MRKKIQKLSVSLVILFFCLLFFWLLRFQDDAKIVEAAGVSWYVDNAATGANDGASWENAWQSFGAIVWGAGGVDTGDTLYISGGATSKTYTGERIYVGQSGITIKVGQTSPHNGVAIINANHAVDQGIAIASKNNVTVSGQVGNDPGQHIKIINAIGSGIDVYGSSNGWNLNYLEIANNGSAVGEVHGLSVGIDGANLTSAQVHHCVFDNNWTDQIHMMYDKNAPHATQFGRILFHDNIIKNTQDDGLELGIDSVDIYNNTFGPRGVWTGRTSGHPDHLQMYGSYYRVYSNTFKDVANPSDSDGNSFVRWEPYSAVYKDAGHLRIYNNLFYNANAPAGGLPRGIEISAFGFGADKPTSVTDIVFANNILDKTWFFGLLFNLGTLGTDAVSNIVIENNIFNDPVVTAGGGSALWLSRGDGTVTAGNHGSGADVILDYNIFNASSAAYKTQIGYGDLDFNTADLFRSTTGLDAHGLTADPLFDSNHAPRTGSPAIDGGVSLSSYFNADYSGATRPSGLAWDIGAYEYVSAPEPEPEPEIDTTPPSAPTGVSVN